MLLIISFIFNLIFADSWHITTVDSESNVSESTDIAIDNNNKPHIVYDGNRSDLRYAHWNGNKWDIQDFKGENYYDLCDGSISIDSNNYPHITYSDYYDYSVYYARWDGNKWIKEEVTDYGLSPDMALDSNDNPHISFNTIMVGAIDYTYKVGDEWKKEIVDKDGVNWYPKIVVDGNDCPQISYIDNKNGEFKYAIKKVDNCAAGWDIQIFDKPEGAYPYFTDTSIAVDRNNYPHIAYCYLAYYEDKYYFKYARWTGSEWDKQVIESGDFVNGSYLSLALDKNDYPHIAYYDGTNGDLKYAWWDGSKWNFEVVDSDGDVGSYCSIDLKKDGSPVSHIMMRQMATSSMPGMDQKMLSPSHHLQQIPKTAQSS
jgi:hypothetical protein